MDRGAWWATVHKVAKSQTQLSDFTHTHTHTHTHTIGNSVLCRKNKSNTVKERGNEIFIPVMTSYW